MEIKVGKKYLTNNGKIVTVICDDGSVVPFGISKDANHGINFWWSRNGVSNTGDKGLDCLKEYLGIKEFTSSIWVRENNFVIKTLGEDTFVVAKHSDHKMYIIDVDSLDEDCQEYIESSVENFENDLEIAISFIIEREKELASRVEHIKETFNTVCNKYL
jgi:hypothetical protein